MYGTINFTKTELKALSEALVFIRENMISDFHGERASLASAKAKIMTHYNHLAQEVKK